MGRIGRNPAAAEMVDLGGYVIILVETKDKKIKLYGKDRRRRRDPASRRGHPNGATSVGAAQHLVNLGPLERPVRSCLFRNQFPHVGSGACVATRLDLVRYRRPDEFSLAVHYPATLLISGAVSSARLRPSAADHFWQPASGFESAATLRMMRVDDSIHLQLDACRRRRLFSTARRPAQMNQLVSRWPPGGRHL